MLKAIYFERGIKISFIFLFIDNNCMAKSLQNKALDELPALEKFDMLFKG